MRKISIFIVLCLSTLLIPISTLSLEDVYEDKTYIIRPFREGDVFIMSWVHSVELEPWEEWFSVVDNIIYLRKTRFKAFGAGVPDQVGNLTYLEDNFIVYDEINQAIPNLTYGISPVAKHTITINNEYIKLFKFVPADTGIKINFKKLNWLQYIILRF